MNTSQCSKVDALLNYGVPKKLQQPRAYLQNVCYIDPMHIMLAVVQPLDMNEHDHFPVKRTFSGDAESCHLQMGVLEHAEDYDSVIVDRKILLTILQAMDSDRVKLNCRGDCPLLITGEMNREMKVQGVIAPRLYEEEVDYYE